MRGTRIVRWLQFSGKMMLQVRYRRQNILHQEINLRGRKRCTHLRRVAKWKLHNSGSGFTIHVHQQYKPKKQLLLAHCCVPHMHQLALLLGSWIMLDLASWFWFIQEIIETLKWTCQVQHLRQLASLNRLELKQFQVVAKITRQLIITHISNYG